MNGLPPKLALQALLRDLLDTAVARGETPPLTVDTFHIPYRNLDYDAALLPIAAFETRYDAVILHIVLNSGARITDAFFETLALRALAPHGSILNRVSCIRKTTLHNLDGHVAQTQDALPCIIKLDRNFNNKGTVFLCHNKEDVEAWHNCTSDSDRRQFVREPLHLDYKFLGSDIYRLERWVIVFDDLTLEYRLSDDFFVKAATSFRYQLRDMRCLRNDWQLLASYGWKWRGQSIDCAYDEDEEAWDARYQVMAHFKQAFGLDYGELDVIRTAKDEFIVIDVNNTSGVLIPSRYCLRLAQAHLVEGIRTIAERGHAAAH